jgi:hypothetical protein
MESLSQIADCRTVGRYYTALSDLAERLSSLEESGLLAVTTEELRNAVAAAMPKPDVVKSASAQADAE